MIRITDKSLCCGCTACMNACPAQCIVMRRDREGFDYPVANPDLCRNCGKCTEICPMPDIKAHVHEESLSQEQSMKVIEEGGVIYAPSMNPDMTVGYAEVPDASEQVGLNDDICVQSDLYATFEDVKYYLEDGRKVVFKGVPCYIAGLKAYLGGEQEGLTLVECGCHGVASPGLWEKCTRQPAADDPYKALFRQHMNLRPSCYSCPARIGGKAEIPEKRAEFFKGYHSAQDIAKYMRGFISSPLSLSSFLKGVGIRLSRTRNSGR